MKKILKISEMCDEYLSLPLEDYILTFENDILKIFPYLSRLEKINTEKIVFIPTSKILKRYLDPNLNKSESIKDRVTINHLLDFKFSSFDIGGNGHDFLDLRENKDNIVNILFKLRRDSEKMQSFFSKELRIRPTKFCFPFDHEIWGYRRILKNLGYSYFFGKERIDIRSLLGVVAPDKKG